MDCEICGQAGHFYFEYDDGLPNLKIPARPLCATHWPYEYYPTAPPCGACGLPRWHPAGPGKPTDANFCQAWDEAAWQFATGKPSGLHNRSPTPRTRTPTT